MTCPAEIAAVLDGSSEGCVICARAEDVLPTIPDASVALSATQWKGGRP